MKFRHLVDMMTKNIHIASIFLVLQLIAPFAKPIIAGDVAGQEQQQVPINCGSAGVQVTPMTGPVANNLGLVESYGAIFERPERGSPAAKAGIEASDVVTTINGIPLEKSNDFRRIIAAWAPGSVVYLNTWRDGQLMPRTLTLGSSPCPKQSSASSLTIHRSNTETVPSPVPAGAFNTSQLDQRGPLLLRGIVQLIHQSTQLKIEVNSALAALGKTVDEVMCTGEQFSGQWNNLAGVRVAPYACNFTNKWLLIEATVAITGPDGKVYDSITPVAIASAATVAERKPIWAWTTKYRN